MRSDDVTQNHKNLTLSLDRCANPIFEMYLVLLLPACWNNKQSLFETWVLLPARSSAPPLIDQQPLSGLLRAVVVYLNLGLLFLWYDL